MVRKMLVSTSPEKKKLRCLHRCHGGEWRGAGDSPQSWVGAFASVLVPGGSPGRACLNDPVGRPSTAKKNTNCWLEKLGQQKPSPQPSRRGSMGWEIPVAGKRPRLLAGPSQLLRVTLSTPNLGRARCSCLQEVPCPLAGGGSGLQRRAPAVVSGGKRRRAAGALGVWLRFWLRPARARGGRSPGPTLAANKGKITIAKKKDTGWGRDFSCAPMLIVWCFVRLITVMGWLLGFPFPLLPIFAAFRHGKSRIHQLHVSASETIPSTDV